VKQIPRVNVTAERVRVADLDSRTFDRLAAMNELDTQLYDFALQIFETKKRQMFRELLESRNRRWTRSEHSHETAESADAATGDEDSDETDSLSNGTSRRVLRKHESFGSRDVEILAAQVIGSRSGTHEVAPGEPVALSISISAHADVPNLTVGFDVSDAYGEVVFGTNTYLRGAVKSVRAGCDYDIVFRFEANLNRGRYSVGASLHTGANHTDCCFHWRDHATEFDVVQLGEPDFIGYCRLEPNIEWWDHAAPTALPEPDKEAVVRESTNVD
jgi:hypothetical protein